MPCFGNRSRCISTCTRYKRKKDPIERTTGYVSCLERHTNRNMENKGALRVHGRTSIKALILGDRNLWMSFLLLENLDDSYKFILDRVFIKSFDLTIDLNTAMLRIRNPEMKYVVKPVNLIMTNGSKAPVFLSRRVRLKANEAATLSLRMKNYNELRYYKQVCIVPSSNSQSAAILGRSFSIAKNGLSVSVLLNTLDIPITNHRGEGANWDTRCR